MFGTLREKLFGPKKESRVAARSRLQFVLVQDRTGLTSEEMAKFKREMVSVIGRYFVIDKSRFDISYERSGETTTLLINSPVSVRRKGDQMKGGGGGNGSGGSTRRIKSAPISEPDDEAESLPPAAP